MKVSAALLVAVLVGFRPILWLCTLRAPQYLGRISFGIYVLHAPVIGVIGKHAEPLLQALFEEHGLAFLDPADATALHLAGRNMEINGIWVVTVSLPRRRLFS